ncbi:MAG: sulfatase-like hydrolase/transferase [Pirellulaceae bacterium]
MSSFSRLVLVVGLFAGSHTLLAEAVRPNLIFICTDDQAPRAVRALGDERFITPHIDRLFHEGVTLRNSFVTTPVCSPSRATLMTSRYGSELGIHDWINPQQEKELGLDPNWPTWPKLLQAAGYQTGLFGKWHLGTADRFHPTKFGYQQFTGIREGGCPPKDPTIEMLDGTDQKVDGFTVDIFTDAALDFIRTKHAEPFVVSLHYREPHAAWLPVRDEDWEPFQDLDPAIPNPDFPNLNVAEVKRRTKEYLASVKSIDRNVGRLLTLLDELNIADNTIVVFTSDHGYNLGEHGTWYKGNAHYVLNQTPAQQWPQIPAGRRPNLWDTSLRVPTAIRWPAKLKAGSTCDRTITNLDWFPTLLAFCGVPLPEDVKIHGRNFFPLLQGKSIAWNDDLFAEYDMRHGATTRMRCYRTPAWKLMQDFANPGRAELYDLTTDPHEMTNLIDSDSADVQAIRQQLEQKLDAAMQELASTRH